jgi:hypothetical protein
MRQFCHKVYEEAVSSTDYDFASAPLQIFPFFSYSDNHRGLQRDVVYLSWLTNSVLVYEPNPKCGGKGGGEL